jgi:truncated hemoglobin YjbI
MSRPEPSLYDRVGGEADFVALVDRFSERVERDPSDAEALVAHVEGAATMLVNRPG